MTAAALLVVLGAALLMQLVGMSMALGAFLAGVLLAESNYRHELEADIEPFRGLLLALFFMGVGMTIDMTIVWANLWLIIAAALVITLLKPAWCGRCSASPARSAAMRCAQARCSPAPASSPSCCCRSAASLGILERRAGQPAVRDRRDHAADRSAVRDADGGRCCVGSRGATQREADDFAGAQRLRAGDRLRPFRADRVAISARRGHRRHHHRPRSRDDPVAGRFGFKVYYGDGTRLDVLRAAGAGRRG